MRCSVRAFRQTSNPPKRFIPLARNPLSRWSRRLPSWKSIQHLLPQYSIGLEGCGSAFNATNSIRTCMFFGTGSPPTFLSIEKWDDVEHAQVRPGSNATQCGSEGSMRDFAQFGEEIFLQGGAQDLPIVALENFTSRSESIFHRRCPAGCRFVVGHENFGVRDAFIGEAGEVPISTTSTNGSTRAEAVLYIPQYGTISSLNVVTSLGVALFYAYVDLHFPASRSVVQRHVEGALLPSSSAPSSSPSSSSPIGEEAGAHKMLHGLLETYQRQFERAIPVPAEGEGIVAAKALSDPRSNPVPRVDPRPIHPLYFKKEQTAVREAHKAFRNALLAYSLTGDPTTLPPAGPRRFGLSVLYENEFDQRNFGGLIRNANAFLVDRVCYVGRRKFNVVGAVGSYHYTPPAYCGPVVGTSDDEDDASSDQLWSDAVQAQVEAVCGGPMRWWFLDCGHDSLYSTDPAPEEKAVHSAAATPEGPDRDNSRHTRTNTPALIDTRTVSASSSESFSWYTSRVVDTAFCLDLCQTEEHLREAAGGEGILLVVPQEGKLPHMGILTHCQRILSVLPRAVMEEQSRRRVRGLPSQVASGIALQRLSAVLHPRIKSI